MKIRLEDYEDWQRIFVGDELVYANHNAPGDVWLSILKRLGHEVENPWYDDADSDNVPYDDKPNPREPRKMYRDF